MIMKNNIEYYFQYVFLFLIFLIILNSCSSAPRNPGDIFNLRNQAESGLVSANREAAVGRFENAFALLTEFKRSAILADDPSLIIRISLSRGNILYALGRTDEAFAEWEQAIAEAVRFGNIELLSVSRIFYARGNLLSGRASPASVLNEINRESINIRNDRLYIAFSWQVRGLALRSLGRWNEAEIAMKNSLEIHEKDRHIENASYDWYIIASIRSLSGDTFGALQALESSIALDRRIENSWGLASSWRAMGDVYRNAGRNEDALQAYRRSRDIYFAMRSAHEVEEIDRRISELN
jgi:tetratricopeptide (TPR) repeat protein